MEPYRIMVVDDSAFMRKIVSDLIEQDPSFKVEATAKNGAEAVEQISALSPDLVTMDVEMPDMNGLEALKIIMERYPVPVIMLSGINEQGTRETIMALELGAFDFIRKPSASTSSHDIDQVGRDLREQIRAAMLMKERRAAREALRTSNEPLLPSPSVGELPTLHKPSKLNLPPKKVAKPNVEIDTRRTKMIDNGYKSPPQPDPKVPNDDALKVHPALQKLQENLRRNEAKMRDKIIPRQTSQPLLPEMKSKEKPVPKEKVSAKEVIKEIAVGYEAGPGIHTKFTDVVAIGTSTGGPKALKAVLEKIPSNFPAPIVIVQHMPANFTKSLAQRLDSLCALNVEEAEEGMELRSGTAYIAPGGFHMNVVIGRDGRYKLTLSKQELRNGHRPSVDVLYESLLPLQTLRRHIVLLTGMGSDGAKVMKRLYDAGVTSTFAESEETCVVYGMPRSAIELKCVSHVLPLHEIGPKLVQVVK
ncbi:protein-glutamate methylesterase/protein-glutamine glutaminase [Paenibacillus segetis]|uniref:Protein-glutamate methylesterase/protein-glutamine glutaminase n=1 Tax=Paenibacillus segetis TaxID=1325360 RepID=A0ABQ1YB42_9BACL|nr:chemotaxis response regulator protein-glutamate methylesterase [Paenibacillus segetis]GGH17725.1 hypothetical protein GCM10008013_13230 [Paenibacillus segetis]